MKKLLLFATAALLLVSCGEQKKAEKAVKQFLIENSNDGKVEIVKFGELKDYTYTYEATYFVKSDIESIEAQLESAKSAVDEFKGTEYEQEYVEKVAELETKLAELQKELSQTKDETYNIKCIDVSFRGNNVFGAEVSQDATLFLNTELTKVGAKPNEVIK